MIVFNVFLQYAENDRCHFFPLEEGCYTGNSQDQDKRPNDLRTDGAKPMEPRTGNAGDLSRTENQKKRNQKNRNSGTITERVLIRTCCGKRKLWGVWGGGGLNEPANEGVHNIRFVIVTQVPAGGGKAVSLYVY